MTHFKVLIPACLLALTVTAPAQAQSRAQRMIDEMIQALGGEAFLKVTNVHSTGRFYGFTRGELSSTDLFADYIKFPDMERTELGPSKNKSITINHGKEGWKIEGKKDPEEQTPGEVSEFLTGFKTSLDYVLRFTIKDPKTTMLALPTEIVGFNRTDVVEIRDPEKNLIRFYIDRQSHLPVKLQVRRNGDPKVREEQYANWHAFQAVQTPLFVSRYTDGVKTMEIRPDDVVYNSDLAGDLFTQSAAK